MALSNKLGASYNEIKNQIKIRTIHIDLGEVKFDLKVRILLKREMEEMITEIATPNQKKIDSIYEKFAAPIKKSIDEGGDDFLKSLNAEKQMIVVKEDDIIVDGNSIKQIAAMSAAWETKVEKYFNLLQSDNGDPITENFLEISEEFPDSVIRKIIEEIDIILKPNYNDVKKN